MITQLRMQSGERCYYRLFVPLVQSHQTYTINPSFDADEDAAVASFPAAILQEHRHGRRRSGKTDEFTEGRAS